MAGLKRHPRGLTIGGFVALEGLVVCTLVRTRVAGAGFDQLSFERQSSLNDLEIAARNAVSTGVAHVGSAEHIELFKAEQLSVYRILSTEEGARYVEVGFLANLDKELHEPGPDCFESYELLPWGILLTPDLSVRERDTGRQLICAVSDNLSVLGGEFDETEELAVRVECGGRPGSRTTVDYILHQRLD